MLSSEDRPLQVKENTFEANFNSESYSKDKVDKNIKFDDVLKDDSGEFLSPVVDLSSSPSEQTEDGRFLLKDNCEQALE